MTKKNGNLYYADARTALWRRGSLAWSSAGTFANTLVTCTIICMVLAGCASTIMESYMNEPLSSAVAKHGPPQFAYDTGDGRRAFGWVMNGAVVMPGTATTTGTMIGGSFYGTTTMSPSVASNYSCVYTVYATRARTDIQGPAAWMIVGYEKPNLMCE